MECEYFLKFSLAFESIFSKHTPKLNLTGIEVLNVQLIIIELLQWNKMTKTRFPKLRLTKKG